MNVYPTAFDAHWLEVQRHLYRHGNHSSCVEFHGWTACLWHYSEAPVASLVEPKCYGTGLILPRPHGERDYDMTRLKLFLDSATIAIPLEAWMIETVPYRDAVLEGWLQREGWTPAYQLPGWYVTKEEHAGWRARQTWPARTGGIKVVRDRKTTRDFCEVQDAAYLASYGEGLRRGAGLFFQDGAALDHPNVLGFVAYDENRPVRTAAMFVFEGVVSVGAGACVPEYRGRHLGDALIEQALAEGFARGAEIGFGTTMPQAVPVAARLQLHPAVTYTRWVYKEKKAAAEREAQRWCQKYEAMRSDVLDAVAE